MAGMKDHTDNATAGPRRSRRMLLAGAAGGLGVLTAEVLARPAPASAGTDGDVVLGVTNTETAATGINNTTDGGIALYCTATRGGVAMYAQAGTTTSSIGSGHGVHGVTDNIAGLGVFGENLGGGAAVGGLSSTSDGVGGTSSSGSGVHGVSSTGIGVLAECPSGIGVRATGATGLSVLGPAVFSRSGTLVIAAGKTSATKTGVALTAASLVLATLQQDRAGVWVRSAVPNVTGSSFTVHLSKTVPASTKVAWFVVN
jgi:hypothetical protein